MKNTDNGIIMMDSKGNCEAKSKSSPTACAFITRNRFAVLDSSGGGTFLFCCLFVCFCFYVYPCTIFNIYLSFFFFFFFRFN